MTSSSSTASIWVWRRADPRLGRAERRRQDRIARPPAGLVVAGSGHLEILGTPVRRGARRPEVVAGFVDGPDLHPSLNASRRRAVGRAIYQVDVTADGWFVADGDGPWQFDGNVKLLPTIPKG